MSVRRLAPADVQPKSFAFSSENQAWAQAQFAKYPAGREASAVIPLLWRAQEQEGWVSEKAIEVVAQMVGLAKIRVLEVATFYTMFQLQPVGSAAHVQVCGTTPCRLRGAGELIDICQHRIHHDQFRLSGDGKLSWEEVECAGACVNAPMIQVFSDTYEDLTPQTFNALLDNFVAGKSVMPGVQSGKRRMSEQEGGQTTLLEPALYDGSAVGSWRKSFGERQAAAAAKAVAAPPPAPPAAAPVPAAPAPSAAPASVIPAMTSKPEDKPVMLSAARAGGPDDLKLIWGVGPKLETMLNEMGVFHFDQIAVWSDKNLQWVDDNLQGFHGRAVRDDWIGQSKKLASGWRPANPVGDKPAS